MGPVGVEACDSVDLEGFEPSTFAVRLRRAPNCATGPNRTGLYLTGLSLSRNLQLNRPFERVKQQIHARLHIAQVNHF